MKKVVFIVILFVVSFFIITNNEKVDSKPIVKQKVIKLIMAHNLPKNSALHDASLLFAKKINEKTDEKIEIEIFPKQELGNDYQMIEMARNGEIDILLTPTAKMSVSAPSMQYADLPFLFPSREDAYMLLDGEPGKMILKNLDKIDLHGVTFWENGFKHFTANSPLTKPEDFENKKMRVMKSRIIMEQFNALNAIPIPIDFHSTKKALKDGVVDGQENPLVAIVNMGFHEVQKHITISEHAYLPYVFSISKNSLSKISTKEQELLINTAIEITKWEREETQKREKEFLETIKNAGVIINTLSDKEKKEFAKKTNHIIQIYESTIGSDIISKTQELLYNKYPPTQTIVFGLDADLSNAEKDSGLAIKRGIELAIDEINENGGLLGKKVMLVSKNHKSISTQGIKNIQEFSEDENVKAIIGGKHSAIIANEMEYIQKSNKPYMIPWAAADSIVNNQFEDNLIFRVSANDKFIIKRLIKQTFKSNKKPLLIVENSVWGRGALNLAKNMNKESLKSYILNRGETNFEEIISTIKKQNIDSLILILNSKEGDNLLKSLSLAKINLPIISHWGIIGNGFYTNNKNYIKNIDFKFIQSFSFKNNKNTIANKVANDYLKKYNLKNIDSITSPSGVAQAYDATKLLATAIQNANSFNSKEITNALKNIQTYKGALKQYNKPFGKNDHEALDENDFFFAKFNALGQIVPIEK